MYLGTSNLSRWMHSGYVHVHVHVHVLYNLPLCTYIHVVIRYVYVTSTVQVPVLSWGWCCWGCWFDERWIRVHDIWHNIIYKETVWQNLTVEGNRTNEHPSQVVISLLADLYRRCTCTQAVCTIDGAFVSPGTAKNFNFSLFWNLVILSLMRSSETHWRRGKL